MSSFSQFLFALLQNSRILVISLVTRDFSNYAMFYLDLSYLDILCILSSLVRDDREINDSIFLVLTNFGFTYASSSFWIMSIYIYYAYPRI